MSAERQPHILINTEEIVEPKVLVCIIVTYHPELPVLIRQIERLPDDAAIVIVDNTSEQHVSKKLRDLISTRKRGKMLSNACNRGLAIAINRGVRYAHRTWPGIRFALLLDQDSEPRLGSVETLLRVLTSLEDTYPPVACVGPALLDTTTNIQHGFHQCDRWKWKRIYTTPYSNIPIPCANLNGSGTMVSIQRFLELGGLEEGLFIDHVDTEWSFRVRAAGYALYGIPNAVFEHRMGDDSRRIWLFGWRTWPMRSPQRHYYLFRNAIILMRRSYVPTVWKIWAVIKLLLTASVHGLTDPQREAQLRCMFRGIRDGLATKHQA
jgi:rhamnosyltransferase